MITKICNTCDAEFKIYPSHKNRNIQHCSRSCRQTGTTLICKTCGKSFYKSKRLLEKFNIQYCSRVCRVKTTCNMCNVKLTTKNTYTRKSGSRKGRMSEKRCKKCSNKIQSSKGMIRGRQRKLRLIQMFGSKCTKCGYDKNYSALVFHHKDPSTKLFCLHQRNLRQPWDIVIVEAKKCILLCQNCHCETHHPSFIL